MNFFSKIFNHKKALFFVFLAALVFSFFLVINIGPAIAATPTQNGAQLKVCQDGCAKNFPDRNYNCDFAHWYSLKMTCTPFALCMDDCGGSIRTGAAGGGGTTANDCIDNFGTTKEIIAGFMLIVEWVPKSVARLATTVANYIIDNILDWPITNPSAGVANSAGASAASAFHSGWITTRDLANMLIVLGFVFVGIATSLRVREYEAKKFLWPLIIVALLINFSGLFCGLIIDASHLTMHGLINASISAPNPNNPSNPSNPNPSGAPDFMAKIDQLEQKQECEAAGLSNGVQKNDGQILLFMGIVGGFMVIYIAIAIAFIYLAVMLLVRYAVLGMLYMIAPLAFVFWAFPFPKAKELWNRWWGSFLKYAFVGVGICFFLNLAAGVLNGLDTAGGAAAGSMYTSGPTVMAVYLFIVLTIIVVGIVISVKGSGLAGVAAMAVGGALFTGAKAVGGAGMQLAGITKTGQWTREKLSSAGNRISEGLGFSEEGSAAEAKGKREADARKQVDALRTSSSAGDQGRFRQLARSGSGAMGAAAVASANEAGDLGKILNNDLNRMGSRAAYATQFGHQWSDFAKKDPRLAQFNDAKVKEYMKPTSDGGRGLNQEGAKNALVSEGFAKSSVPDIRNFSEDVLKHKAFIQNTPMKRIVKAGEEMSASKISAIKTHIPDLKKEAYETGLSGSRPNITAHNEAVRKVEDLRTL